MCGITGFLDTSSDRRAGNMEAVVEGMASTLRHRGPDDGGTWVDARAGVALGFRRLAILDLSRHGHQPMVSSGGRHTVVFNGEIYNFAAVRDALSARGHAFRGFSDTEVLLAAVTEWGLRDALPRLQGMFALALWDREAAELTLVRDRLGKKPLYYGWAGETFLFGSELKALRAHPALRPEVDRAALAGYLRHGYVQSPDSILRGIGQLRPGNLVRVSARRRDPESETWWSLEAATRAGAGEPFAGSADEALDELDALLRDAVLLRMIADVPIGAFLSGGTDSSLIVSLMAAQSAAAVRTFTVGFTEGGYDEAPTARRVAAALGTDHTEIYVSPDEAREVIPRLPALYDEPFADSSQVPTHLISGIARSKVTVCLSGDGGDELFGGYGRYRFTERMWERISRVPPSLRPGAARSARTAARLADRLALAPPGARATSYGDRGDRLAAMLGDDTPGDLYERLVGFWDPEEHVVRGTLPLTPRTPVDPDFPLAGELMLRDGLRYLPDNILTKVDRASMAVGLEVRSPILDHRVVELAARLPLALKIRAGEGKWPLRALLRRYLPAELVDRPKAGFDVPVAAWLRGPLRAWAEELLDPCRLEAEGYLRPGPVRAKWEEHLSGRRNWQHQLWAILMFEAWLDAQPS